MTINSHGLVILIQIQQRAPKFKEMEEKVSSFHKICASHCNCFRKQRIKGNTSYDFSLHRCPSVQVPKREYQEKKLDRASVYSLTVDCAKKL